MKLGLLFWGFQDLNLVSEVSKKIRYSLNIKDFYIQILDSEKTISLMDLYPEEIIRTKCDLNNLYLWLIRNNKKDIFIMIDLFSIIFQENFIENCVALNKILELKYKFCFIAPKIIYPQNIEFLNNQEMNSIHQKTINYTRYNKALYEIILNSKSDSKIIAFPVSGSVTLNREIYSLFESKKLYIFKLFPNILKKFNACYINQYDFTLKLVDMISHFILQKNKNEKLTLFNIKANYNINYNYNYKDILSEFILPIPVSLERFFKIKNPAQELKFILWLMYLSICEYEVQTEGPSDLVLSSQFFSA